MIQRDFNPVRPQSATLPQAPTQASTREAQAARAPVPTQPGQGNQAYDGHLIGGDGNAYPPGTEVGAIPPVQPRSGQRPTQTLLFVNGIGESRGHNKNHLQRVADATGQNVVGVYNATQGGLKDLVQALKDKNDLGTNHAVDSLADTVYAQLKAGQPVNILAHSQGAIITSRAMGDVKNRLMLEDGLSKGDAEALMRNVQVQTMGGAAGGYPDGPRYTHYVNRADLVPMAFGLGRGGDPGEGAKVVKFGWPNPFGVLGGAHDTGTYFDKFIPFAAR